MANDSEKLTLVFRALGDGTRRKMLEMLKEKEMTLSELAEPFSMTLAGVLKHVRILAAAGLIDDQKTGRVRHCRLDDGPLLDAAVWINRHSKYWQSQFETLAGFLATKTKGEK